MGQFPVVFWGAFGILWYRHCGIKIRYWDELNHDAVMSNIEVGALMQTGYTV